MLSPHLMRKTRIVDECFVKQKTGMHQEYKNTMVQSQVL